MTVIPSRILVIKLADIGDAVLALPAIQAIRAGYPNAEIDVLTTAAGANVFELSPAVDRVLTLAKQRFDHISGLISFRGIAELVGLTARLRRGRYEAVFMLHHLTTSFGARKFRALARATAAPIVVGLDNGRGAFLTHAAMDYGFGALPEWRYALSVVESFTGHARSSRPNIVVPESAGESARRILERSLGDASRYAVIHAEVGDFSTARAWRDDYFAEVARHLISTHDLPVLLVGTERDRAGHETLASLHRVHDLVGETTFPELCDIVRNADLVVGCDSSVAHLAGAFDRPSITLFGPSNVAAWKPFGSVSKTITDRSKVDARSIACHLDMPCSPCLYTGYRLGRPQGCRSRACMMNMQPWEVIRMVDSVLAVAEPSP